MAEQRLIDAKALWKDVDKLPSVLDANNGWLVKKTSVLAKIEDATIVEPKPVVHAYWFLLDDCANEGVYCSACTKKVYKTDYANQKLKSKYCPNCGTQMDEKENDNATY